MIQFLFWVAVVILGALIIGLGLAFTAAYLIVWSQERPGIIHKKGRH